MYRYIGKRCLRGTSLACAVERPETSSVSRWTCSPVGDFPLPVHQRPPVEHQTRQWSAKLLRTGWWLLLGAAVASGQAYATTFSCGPWSPAFLGVDSSGVVFSTVKGAPGPIGVCNVTTTADNTSADTCRSAYAEILTARATGRKITFYFNSDQPSLGGIATCAGLGSWTTRVSYFVELDD